MDAFVTREPVDRELRRRQLAQRLVTHHARTQTIFRLTGLSRHQLTTLRQRWGVPDEMRHRGPPPASFAVLLSTQRVREEAAALAVFWQIFASVGAARRRSSQPSMMEVGECICEVLEAYLASFARSVLELEHLVLLARGIEEADAIALSKCGNCDAVILADLLGTRRRVCSHCQRASTTAAALRGVPAATEAENSPGSGEAIQGELF